MKLTRYEFENELIQYGMSAKFYENGIVTVGRSEFANPLLFFNQDNSGNNYNGEVTVKSINSSLFSPTQIAMALFICNKFLSEKEQTK